MIELQKIYDSEINFIIRTFWDAGFEVALGDEMNGILSEKTVDKVEDIVPWLQKEILVHFPESNYSKGLIARKKAIFRKTKCCNFITGLRKGNTICLRCEKKVI